MGLHLHLRYHLKVFEACLVVTTCVMCVTQALWRVTKPCHQWCYNFAKGITLLTNKTSTTVCKQASSSTAAAPQQPMRKIGAGMGARPCQLECQAAGCPPVEGFGCGPAAGQPGTWCCPAHRRVVKGPEHAIGSAESIAAGRSGPRGGPCRPLFSFWSASRHLIAAPSAPHARARGSPSSAYNAAAETAAGDLWW